MTTIAIIGRPNVGKSTLFNRLIGHRHALVDDTPGVTRDFREGDGRLADLHFRVIDTAGLEDDDPDTISGRMRRMTERAVDEADIVLFMTDARAGLTPDDEYFARAIRRAGKPVIVLANKAEGKHTEAGVLEAYQLGLGDPVAFSAAHGAGLDELHQR
ncbi:MAG TPA: GTP-binding protein, partial [Thermopetrobacter sp.]|nr:GTP-binding protein [Thermopetrobacter sp.]